MVVIRAGQTQERQLVGVGVVPTFPTGNVQEGITGIALEATCLAVVDDPLVTCRLVDDNLEVRK
jgi:hypothetical protein